MWLEQQPLSCATTVLPAMPASALGDLTRFQHPNSSPTTTHHSKNCCDTALHAIYIKCQVDVAQAYHAKFSTAHCAMHEPPYIA